MRRGEISIVKVISEDQLADIMTKAQTEILFLAQPESILQWQSETLPRAEPLLIPSHLRACDIPEPIMDQNDRGQHDSEIPKVHRADIPCLIKHGAEECRLCKK